MGLMTYEGLQHCPVCNEPFRVLVERKVGQPVEEARETDESMLERYVHIRTKHPHIQLRVPPGKEWMESHVPAPLLRKDLPHGGPRGKGQ